MAMEIPIGVAMKQVPVFGKDITWPVHLEPKIPTMDKKLIIDVAPVGALISKKQNPTQPDNLEEIAKDVIESYNEGAAMFHVHTREDGAAVFKPDHYKQVLDMVYKKAPDMITSICTVSSFTHEGAEHRIKPMIEPLLKFGRKYCEIAVINPITMAIGPMPFIATPEGIEEETKCMEDHGVKPELAAYNLPAMVVMKEHLIDTGIAKKPYFMDIACGPHNCTPTTPDPEGIINLIQVWRSLPEGAVWQAIIGGRNWLPLTVLSIMLGADAVRLGKEDMVHMYPHKDDKITTCASVVRKIATIAKELGRDIATPSEARKIIGLKP